MTSQLVWRHKGKTRFLVDLLKISFGYSPILLTSTIRQERTKRTVQVDFTRKDTTLRLIAKKNLNCCERRTITKPKVIKSLTH